MEKLKKLGSNILLILFPLGMVYCIIHTIGKEFTTFLGSILIFGIGIVIGIQIVEPQLFSDFFARIGEWLTFK